MIFIYFFIKYKKVCTAENLCLVQFIDVLMDFGIVAALIPLDEFKEMNLPVQYGINPDMEVLDILETAAKTKQVLFFFFLFK